MTSTATAPAHLVGRSLRTPVAWGAVFGVIQVASPLAFRWLDARTVYALGIPLIAAVYIGFAVADGRRHVLAVETTGLTVLDLVGPLQVLTMLQRLAPGYRTTVVWARREPVPTDAGVAVVPDRTFEEVPHPAIVLVPGGAIPTIRAMSDPLVRDYVRSAAASAELVTSVCTGSLILGAVGLLEGRDATTNWFYSGILENLGATYHQRRWVEDGNLIMSAGVSAGIDMALHLAARLTDEATARRVQRAIDYDPQPPWGGIDYDHIARFPRALRGVIGLLGAAIAAKPRRLARAGA
jgi:putative intracellular protease/amidase